MFEDVKTAYGSHRFFGNTALLQGGAEYPGNASLHLGIPGSRSAGLKKNRRKAFIQKPARNKVISSADIQQKIPGSGRKRHHRCGYHIIPMLEPERAILQSKTEGVPVFGIGEGRTFGGEKDPVLVFL